MIFLLLSNKAEISIETEAKNRSGRPVQTFM